jgi:hypothetical protein
LAEIHPRPLLFRIKKNYLTETCQIGKSNCRLF